MGPPRGNRDYSWEEFDPEAYVGHYYGDPHPDDDQAVRLTCAALARAGATGPLDVVDVGTGPNLFPILAALPFASTVTAWEYSLSNVTWLREQLGSQQLQPAWRHFWDIVRSECAAERALPENPAPLLVDKARLRQASIFELPQHRWDAATMFFCAESITERRDEFERACACFAQSVKPGGALVAAFLAGSRGYTVAERPFPALQITEAEIQALFGSTSDEVVTRSIGAAGEEIRSGYSGMVFLTARSKSGA